MTKNWPIGAELELEVRESWSSYDDTVMTFPLLPISLLAGSNGG